MGGGALLGLSLALPFALALGPEADAATWARCNLKLLVTIFSIFSSMGGDLGEIGRARDGEDIAESGSMQLSAVPSISLYLAHFCCIVLILGAAGLAGVSNEARVLGAMYWTPLLAVH